MGLLTSHERIGTPHASAYRSMVRDGKALGHVAVAQGLLWNALEIEEDDAVLMSGYQSAASLTTAAIRLGLIGAIELEPIAGEPTKRAFSAFLKAYEKGILIRTTGDIIAMSPPLIISKAEIDRLIGTLKEVLDTLD